MCIRKGILPLKILKRWKIHICAITIVTAFIFLLIIIIRKSSKDLSCYNIEAKSVVEMFTPSHKAIFFLETSCKGNLNARQICSVESAARAHPDWQINVLFTAPVNTTFAEQINDTNKELTNVEFRRIDLNKYAEGTPAWSLVSDGRLDSSSWRVSHASDVLRFITLYKWGGIYLDLDVIVAKSLEELSRNWVAYESHSSLGTAALSFSRDGIGRLFADTTIRELEGTFSADSWGYNGPGVITRVLKRICSTDNITAMSEDICSGLTVYNSNYFYPVKWQEAKTYFEASNKHKIFPDSYGYHVWNHMSHNLSIEKGSMYDELARKYCPSIYNTGKLN